MTLKLLTPFLVLAVGAPMLVAQGLPESNDVANANGNAAGASPAAVGTQCYGSFDSSGTDNDFWSFAVNAGDRVVIWTTERGSFTWLASVSDDPKLELIDTDGVTVLASNNDANDIKHAQIAYTFSTPGTYYVNVIANAGDTGDYAIDLLGGVVNPNLCNGNYNVAAAEVEPNNDCPSATASLCCDEHLNTLQSAGDSDYYSLVLPAGATVTWETHASTATTGSACSDTKLWLYDASYAEIASNDDIGGGNLYSRITRNLTAGTYYVEVSHWQRNGAGDYSLTIDCMVTAGTTISTLHKPVTPDNMEFTAVFNPAGAEVEPNDACASAGLVHCDEDHLNTLQAAGDVDYYRIDLASAKTLTFETRSSTATTGSACSDTKIWLYDSTCAEIANDDDGGAGLYSKLTQSLSAGTYYLEVSHWQRNGSGDYGLTIDCGQTSCFGTSGKELRIGERLGERSRMGTQYTTDVEEIPTTNICVMLMGVFEINPPINLALVGMSGCPLGVNHVAMLAGVPSVAGQCEVGFFIPTLNALAGGQIVLQALAVDPGANALSIITSRNRLTLTIGNENY